MKVTFHIGVLITLAVICGCSKPVEEPSATNAPAREIVAESVESPSAPSEVSAKHEVESDTHPDEAYDEPDHEHETETFLIQGRVTHARTGEAIENAKVIAYSFNAPIADTVTDADGAYSLSIEVHEGFLEFMDIVQCAAPNFARVLQNIESQGPFEDGGELNQDFSLRSGTSLAGVVLERDTLAPLAGVSVGIAKASLEEFSVDEEFLLDTVLTDEDGAFAFESLAAGPYRIVADGRALGYAADTDATTVANVSDSGGPDNLRLGLNRGGRVTGRVLGPDGAPVADAWVEAESEEHGEISVMLNSLDRQDVESEPLRTDADGNFEVSGLSMEQNYAFLVTSDGFAAAMSPIVRLTRSHPERQVEIQLTHGVSVSGIVLRSNGNPAAEAHVSVQPPGDAWEFDLRHLHASSIAGRDGRFEIENVHPGQYEISASTMGDSGSYESSYDWESDEPQVIVVSTGRSVSNITIQLQPPDEDFGMSGPVRGVVQMSSLVPVPNVTVTLKPGPLSDSIEMTVVTDSKGAFVFEGVEYGNHTVSARNNGQYAVKHGVEADSEITLTLSPELKLTGTAYDENGDTVPNARVELESELDRPVPMMEAMRRIGDEDDPGLSETDDDGRFEFALSEPGTYSVTVTSSSRGKGGSEVVRLDSANRSRDIRVELVTGGAYSGVIVNTSNAPIASARLTLVEHQKVVDMFEMARSQSRSNTGIAVSGPDGSFTIPDVPPGSYKLTVEHNDFAPARAYFDMQPRRNSAQNRIVMTQGGCVYGLAQVDLEPRAGITVTLNGVTGSFDAETDANGAYEMCFVPEGTYNVMLFDVNDMSGNSFDMNFSRKVEVVEGERVEANIVPASDSVTVTGELTNVPPDTTVMVMLMQGFMPGHQSIVEEDGSFNLGLVTPGDYVMQIMAIPEDIESISDPTELMKNMTQRTVSVPAGGDYHLELEYEAP